MKQPRESYFKLVGSIWKSWDIPLVDGKSSEIATLRPRPLLKPINKGELCMQIILCPAVEATTSSPIQQNRIYAAAIGKPIERKHIEAE